MVERTALRAQAARAAVNGNAFEVARRIASGGRNRFEIENQIVRDEQIEASIAIIVDPGAARAPASALVPEAGCPGDVGERAVAIVAVERVLSPLRDEDIVEAVVIVIADGDSEGPVLASQAGVGGDIGKRPVAVVPVEAVRGVGDGAVAPGSRKGENIQPAVVIVVDKRHPAADGFENIIHPIGRSENHRLTQSGGLSDIGEAGVKRQPGRLAARLWAHSTRRHAARLLSPSGARANGQQREEITTGHEGCAALRRRTIIISGARIFNTMRVAGGLRTAGTRC